jgi:diaminohydroxyphosphoribosylaminopyrimidine deaminase/5-amino-6-(5-phosphoribosylamino)uracil reductase
MAVALSLAQRSLGRVWPNPAVGCVIADKEGRLAGAGWTQDGGRPHAETEAIRQAGARARGGVAYVSLEPCAHHGQTGPCASALIASGVARVVSALEDPDPRVAGKGHEMLRMSGIAVTTGVLQSDAERLNAGFLSRLRRGRPLVTLKLATTLDGRIALPSGQSQWITGPEARAHAHLVRAQHDAVLVGIGTVLADDPELTCRLPGIHHPRLVRVIADTHAKLPEASRLVRSAGQSPVWLLTARPDEAESLARHGVRVLPVAAGPGGVDLSDALARLASEGLTRLMVEGGSRLHASLLRLNLADRLVWYRAAAIMGEGVPAFCGTTLVQLDEMPRFLRRETRSLGQDVLETYEFGT